MSAGKDTYDTDQPWIVYHYGLTHDLWWPFWNSTRFLGVAKIVCECAVCGDRTVVRMKIPRVGPITEPPDGVSEPRRGYKHEHAHPDRGSPMSWAKPLLNPAAHAGGLDLDALAMRLEADLNEGGSS